MRVLELPRGAAPRDWGRIHGESYRGEIRSLAEIRVYLTCKVGGFPDSARVLDVANAHLPVLQRYDAALYQELLGIADGANISPGHAVVLNHYTDLRDIDSHAWPDVPEAEERPDIAMPHELDGARAQTGDADGGCSIVWAETEAGPIAAQTWDMHATAIPYVLMMHVPEHRVADDHAVRPETWLFSLTGCLGMAGMNRLGVGLAINNLHSMDARVGVLWPALVRRALCAESARLAARSIMRSPVGSGHHYLSADALSAYGIETSGECSRYIFAHDQRRVRDRPGAYVHTNHSLDSEIARRSRVPATSSTFERLAWLEDSLRARPIESVHDAWERLGSDDGYPRSVCTNMATPENPHGTATCGAVAMELAPDGTLWAAPGLIHNVAPERFAFSSSS